MMKSKFFPALVLALSIASCGCTQKDREVPDPPQGDFIRMADDVPVPSNLISYPVTLSILLPKSYISEPDRRYPVVYMLHGLGDNPKSWNDKWLSIQSTIESLENEGLGDMIYVFPAGFKTYYCNRYNGKWPFMDMLTTELIPFVDETYRTIADKEHRAVTGYSMGGFGACALALKHPELFAASAPLSMSFRTDEQYMTESQDGWDSQWGEIFGGKGLSGSARLTDYYKAHCPFYQFTEANKDAVSSVKWYFTCGDDEEQLLIAGDNLHKQMRDCGIAHEYRVADGGHTGSYWRTALREVLPMFEYYMVGGSMWSPQAAKEEVRTVDFENAFVSPYYESGKGSLVLLAHSGLDKAALGRIIAAMDMSDYLKSFVIYPCDISQKSLEEWKAEASSVYSAGKCICVSVRTNGSQALAHSGEFERCIFIDCYFSTPPSVSEGQKVFFACSDEAAGYAGMNALYLACKASKATFEYRVINSSGDPVDDYVRSIQSIISYLSY